MKNNIKPFILGICALSASQTYATEAATQGNFGLQGEIGLSMPKKLDDQSFTISDEKLENSVSFGLSGFYEINPNFSLGLGANYLPNAKTKAFSKTDQSATIEILPTKLESIALEVSTTYSFGKISDFKPFITGSLGVARNILDNVQVKTNTLLAGGSSNAQSFNTQSQAINTFSGGEYKFAYSVGAGISYDIQDNVSLDITYKFRDHGKFKGSSNKEFNTVEAYTGAKPISVDLQTHNISLGLKYRL